MNVPHPSFLFQADDQIELGRRRAAKAARLCPPPPPSPSAPSSSIEVDATSASRYASLGHPIFLGTKQDDTAELALGGSGADGGREKILDALLEDPAGRCRGLWTAESGGIVRRVDLRTGKTTDVILAHKAPVSALALLPLPSSKASSQALLFSSGWDKSINIHLITLLSPSEEIPERPRRLKPLLTIHSASTDFIKALEVLGTEGILLSGGSEKVLRIWDLRPLIAWVGNKTREEQQPPPTPRSIGSFGEHTRSITCITSLSPPPLPLTSATKELLPSSTIIYTADSMGRIFQLSLDLGESAVSDDQATSSLPPPRARMVIQRELRGPETSISDLAVGWLVQKAEDDEDEDEDDDTELDLQNSGAVGSSTTPTTTSALIRAQVWTASNDKTVQLFTPFESDTRSTSNTYRSLQKPSAPQLSRVSKVGTALGSLPPLSPILSVRHDDYVKSILPLSVRPQQDALPRSLMVSGSADEDLRVWKIHGMGNEDEDEEDADADADLEDPPPPPPTSKNLSCKLLRRQEGHWHELEKLLLWKGHISFSLPSSFSKSIEGKEGIKEENEEEEEWYVVSTSLDGSIRRWNLSLLLSPQSREDRDGLGLRDGMSVSTTTPLGETMSEGNGVRTGLGSGERDGGEASRSGGMTAEEERELEELMGSDDDDE